MSKDLNPQPVPEAIRHLDFEPQYAKDRQILDKMNSSGESPEAAEIRSEAEAGVYSAAEPVTEEANSIEHSRKFPAEMAIEYIAIKDPEKAARVCSEIDRHLEKLYEQAEEVTDWNPAVVTAYMRAAYGTGYDDSAVDPQGEFYKRLGYRHPLQGA
ncbi:MAG: hypothetical protein WD877_01310 [Candidatus Saccharimonadales bacterium]